MSTCCKILIVHGLHLWLLQKIVSPAIRLYYLARNTLFMFSKILFLSSNDSEDKSIITFLCKAFSLPSKVSDLPIFYSTSSTTRSISKLHSASLCRGSFLPIFIPALCTKIWSVLGVLQIFLASNWVWRPILKPHSAGMLAWWSSYARV